MKERVIKNAAKVFNLRKKEDQKWAKKVKLKKQASKPMQGPYYWLYLKPNWVLKAYPLPGDTDTIDHTVYWDTLVDIAIAPHYKIKDPKRIQKLKNAPYAMLRGRVQVLKDLMGNPKWVVYHGNDFKMNDAQKKALIEAFNLGAMFVNGRVSFLPDDHEIMLSEDNRVFKSIIQMPETAVKRLTFPKPKMDFDDE